MESVGTYRIKIAPDTTVTAISAPTNSKTPAIVNLFYRLKPCFRRLAWLEWQKH